MSSNNNKNAIITLSAGHFILDNYSNFITPILPLLVAKLNTTMAVITGILSIGHIGSSLLQPLFGYIADRWKRRFFLVIGLFLGSIFYSFITMANSLFMLGFCIVMGSLGSGFYHPQATGLMLNLTNNNNTVKDMGLFLACGTMGYALGPVISSAIINFCGMKYLPYAVITGIICAFCILKFVPKITKTVKENEERPRFREALKVILKDKVMLLLLMIATFKSMISMIFGIFPPFLWTEQGFSTFHIGIIIFVFLAVSALGTYSSRFFEERIGTIATFRLSMMSSLPLAILYFTTYKYFPILSLVFYFMAGYFAMLSVSINMVLAQRHLPQYKSIIAGFMGGVSWGIVGICLGLFGLVAQTYGIDKLLITMSLLPFVGAYLLKFLPKSLAYK